MEDKYKKAIEANRLLSECWVDNADYELKKIRDELEHYLMYEANPQVDRPFPLNNKSKNV